MKNERFQHIQPYVPGQSIDEVAKKFHLPKSRIIKLASNENVLGPSRKAQAAMKKVLAKVHLYPDGTGSSLREKLAKTLKIKSDHIILGNGSNEVIEFVTRVYLHPMDEVVISQNTFSLYETFSLICGAKPIKIPLLDYAFDLDEAKKRITSKTKIVFICNPNNPTGALLPHSALQDFIVSLPASVLVVLDEAYGDFRPSKEFQQSLKFLRFQNVLLLRTFSKLHGLAGLRIGYGLAHPKIIQLLNKARQPFNVNGLAQVAALAALDDKAHQQKSRELVKKGKAFLAAQLKTLGFQTLDSSANFICVEVGKAKTLFEALQRKGILIRPLDSFGMPEFIRITIGTEKQNKKFIECFKKAVSNENNK